MTEEEKSVINKLESIRVNVEGKLYNFEAARILYLINKLQQENSEKDKEIKYWKEQAEGYQGLSQQIDEEITEKNNKIFDLENIIIEKDSQIIALNQLIDEEM